MVWHEEVWLGTVLLPLKESVAAEFVVPSVMSPTKWCQRPLSISERWKAHDVPDEVIGSIGKDSLLPLNSFLAPGRCYEEGARILLQNYNVLTADGDVHVAATHAHPIQMKSQAPRDVDMRTRMKDFDEEPTGRESFRSPTPRSLFEVEGRGRPSRPEVNRTFVPHMPTVLEEEEAAYDRATRSGVEEGPLDLDPKTRDLKAAKADDAPIPEYLWDDDAMRTENLPRCRSTQRAFRVLRRGMLRFWKRRLTVEYGGWLRSRMKKWEAAPSSVYTAGTTVYTHRRTNQPVQYV